MTQQTIDILVLSRSSEKSSNLAFLLRLSSLQAILIDDDIEAFNYLVQRQQSAQPVSLLVVPEAEINQPILHLLDELLRREALPPTLLATRQGGLPLEQLNCSAETLQMIKTCETDQTYSNLREILGNPRQMAAHAL